MTYGLRWDVDFAPTSTSGPGFNAVTGFDLSNLSTWLSHLLARRLTRRRMAMSRHGSVWPTRYPRIQNRQTVLRGGFGVFYDLASSEAGNIAEATAYPFGAFAPVSGNFPLSAAEAAPPPIVPPTATNFGTLNCIRSASQTAAHFSMECCARAIVGETTDHNRIVYRFGGQAAPPNRTNQCAEPKSRTAELVTNASTSDYNALQLQFQRRLSHGLQALASYTWSHSIDTASAGSPGSGSNELAALNSNVNRGPSDFDRRQALSAALTYDVPSPRWNTFAKALLRGWSTENVVQAQSAPPVNVYYSFLGELATGFFTNPRPDVLGSQPFYLYGPQYPGGKSINNSITLGGCPDGSDMVGPFCPPPTVNGLPTRQGNMGRNALRGFDLVQWDFAVHRDFPIHESIKLQFRAEMFNVLNHPNFGPPVGDIQLPSAVNP